MPDPHVQAPLVDLLALKEVIDDPDFSPTSGHLMLYYKRGEGLKLRRFGMDGQSILVAEEQDSADAILQAEKGISGGVAVLGEIFNSSKATRVPYLDANGRLKTQANLVYDDAAHALDLYNVTGANEERAFVGWSANTFYIISAKLAAGTLRDIAFLISGTGGWKVSKTGGDLLGIGGAEKLGYADAYFKRAAAKIMALDNDAHEPSEYRVHGSATKYASMSHDGTDAIFGNSDGPTVVGASSKPLSLRGGQLVNVGLKADDQDYTVLAGDFVIRAKADSAPRAVNLPSAATSEGRLLVVKKTDASANAVNVTPDGTDEIDGLNAAYALAAQFDSVTLICNDGAWWVI